MKVNIIGRGNVASHLKMALRDKIESLAVNPHTLENLDLSAEITLIAVSDAAIKSVATALANRGYTGIVAHTSGSTPMDIFDHLFVDYGVFYPLQTFSKDKSLDYSSIPFFIEGSDNKSATALSNLAESISSKVNYANSDQRKRLHLAAVFACNFTNHLWQLASEILDEGEMELDMLLPLMEETLEKVRTMSPRTAQTGPAVRGDTQIMNLHINNLKEMGFERQSELYASLSQSIWSQSQIHE